MEDSKGVDFLIFLKQYLFKPRTTGAIAPSSKRLASKMIENIDFGSAKCIVEYGPGTGVFTDKLLKRRKRGTLLILIEYNEYFYKLLKYKYRNESNLYIVNDSAERIESYLSMYNIPVVDYIVSGLPFASLPKEVSSNIMKVSKRVLSSNGKFITFQYTLLKKSFINSYFTSIGIKRVIVNIPPAYVLTCND
jgi:phospholipid N-methyltransferase